jgi:hypothetical protein
MCWLIQRTEPRRRPPSGLANAILPGNAAPSGSTLVAARPELGASQAAPEHPPRCSSSGIATLPCHATSNIQSREVTLLEEVSVEPGAEEDLLAQRDIARQQFHTALQSMNGEGPISYARFRQLCERHLPVFGQTDSVARVAYNLALDYETQHGDSLRARPEVLARLALGYLNAVQELRTQPRYELNCPFLFATPEGPKHFARSLDVATIIALSERDPDPRHEAASIGAASAADADTRTAAEPAPKRGFWSKLLG